MYNFSLLQDDNDKWVSILEDLFIFFSTSQYKHVFKEHLHYLVKSCKVIAPACFVSRFFTEEGTYLVFPFTTCFLILLFT